jgi:Histidine kinase-like ATPase domain
MLLFSFGNDGYNLSMSERIVELLRVAVPCDARAPGLIRNRLEGIQELESMRADAKLVASELVSNAVRHSRGEGMHEIDVRVGIGSELIEISVHDPGLAGVGTGVRPQLDSDGLGFMLVEEFAHRWGADGPDGQVVWAQLTIPPALAGDRQS